MELKCKIYDIPLERIPNIDLYVDQIVELFSDVTLIGEDKAITKAMINNYSKAKILKNIKGRKYDYSRTIIIGIINRLKQSLSLTEIKNLLDIASKDILLENGEYSTVAIEKIYKNYIEISLDCLEVSSLYAKLKAKSSTMSKGEFTILKTLCLCKLSQELRLNAF